MKKLLFSLLAAVMLPVTASAQQIVYSYDAAGNRISRSLATRGSNDPRKKAAENSASIKYDNSVFVGPNPTKGPLTIRLSRWDDATTCHLLLSNTAGQVLAEQMMTSTESTFDLGHYPNGYYLLQVELNEEKKTYKIVKK